MHLDTHAFQHITLVFSAGSKQIVVFSHGRINATTRLAAARAANLKDAPRHTTLKSKIW
jgi:hypothetical protein